MEEQTIRNLFEAYLQTSYLSSDNIIELLRIQGENGKFLAMEYYNIRNEYLDNVEENEEHIEDFINRMIEFIS